MEKNLQHELLRKKLNDEGYIEQNATISVLRANIFGVLLPLPLIVLLCFLYFVVWPGFVIPQEFGKIFLLFLGALAFIPIHEVFHGVGWCFSCEHKWKSISFGVIWKHLTPYCHCREPLSLPAYLAGLLLPAFALGIVLFWIALVFGSPWLLALSLLNLMAAGGDMLIAVLLPKFRGALIVDHPTDCGFLAYRRVPK